VFEIGNSLREARERRGFDFPELEVTTKIRAKYLRALEDEQFEVLPSPTYVKGFLKSYANFLGLEGQRFVDEYNSRFLVDREEESAGRVRRSEVRPKRDRRLERNVILIAVVGIGVVAALIIAAWRFGGGASPSHTATPPAKTRAKRTEPKTSHLVVQAKGGAKGGSSFLQVRLGSGSGRAVFQGTLERGERQDFTAKRLWLSIGTPEHLLLTLNGRPLHVGGAKPCVLIVTKQVEPAGPGSC